MSVEGQEQLALEQRKPKLEQVHRELVLVDRHLVLGLLAMLPELAPRQQQAEQQEQEQEQEQQLVLLTFLAQLVWNPRRGQR